MLLLLRKKKKSAFFFSWSFIYQKWKQRWEKKIKQNIVSEHCNSELYQSDKGNSQCHFLIFLHFSGLFSDLFSDSVIRYLVLRLSKDYKLLLSRGRYATFAANRIKTPVITETYRVYLHTCESFGCSCLCWHRTECSLQCQRTHTFNHTELSTSRVW